VLPEQFGPYQLEELIGRGGMGEVYRAFDTRRNRRVALKRLPPELASDAQFQVRFRRESELAARLAEPHVIPIHDFGEIDGRLYIDMRLVSGADMGELLKREGPMPAARAVALISQVAAALDAAHAEGLVHRDVKPSNVLVVPGDFAYLVDFGVAREVDGEHTALTNTGSTVGTLGYLAPERFEGRGDHRVDVYALACVLFEVLAGRKPFPATSLPALLHAHLNVPPPRPTDVRPELPRGLDDVVARGMAKDPDARYASTGALAEAARAALVVRPETATVVRPQPQGASGPRPTARFAAFASGSGSPGAPTGTSGPVPSGAAGLPPYRTPGPPPGGAPGWSPPGAVGGPPSRAAGRPKRRRWIVPVVLGVVLLLVVGVVGAAMVFKVDDAANVATPAAPSIAAPTSPGASSSIDLGGENEYVAISPVGYVGYVTSSTPPSSLKVVSDSTELAATIPVGSGPQRVTISPDGTRAYVANLSDSSVTVIDTADNSVLATMTTGESTSPYEVAVSPDGTRAYVTTAFDVQIFDTANNSPAGLIDFPAGSLTNSIAITPDGARAYVGSSDSSVSVVELATNTR